MTDWLGHGLYVRSRSCEPCRSSGHPEEHWNDKKQKWTRGCIKALRHASIIESLYDFKSTLALPPLEQLIDVEKNVRMRTCNDCKGDFTMSAHTESCGRSKQIADDLLEIINQYSSVSTDVEESYFAAISEDDKKLVELHAVSLASEHFRSKGFSITDVSTKELAIAAGLEEYPGFDFLANKGHEIRMVEVKGTTRGWNHPVEITANEVRSAKENPETYCLFIAYSIVIIKGKASKGISKLFEPWNAESYISTGELRTSKYKFNEF